MPSTPFTHLNIHPIKETSKKQLNFVHLSFASAEPYAKAPGEKGRLSKHFILSSFQSFLIVIALMCVGAISNAQTLEFSATGYDMHIELNWDTVTSADRYEIWRRAPGETDFSMINSTRQLRMQDWTGRDQPQSENYRYYINALSLLGDIITTSDTLDAFVSNMSDEQFLDMVQEYTFRYFWEYAHPVSRMARERLGSDDIVTTGGTGFGVMSIIVGVHRGWVTREEAVDHLLQMVSFLQFADRFHGVFPHWMDGKTGEVYPFSTFDNGGDLVETAFLMQGLLAARGYFDSFDEKEVALRDVITSLWEDVEWDFYSRGNSGVLYWHWSPDYQWQMNFPIRGYNEALIVYLLAIASPTHPVPASYWHTGWAGGNYVSGFSWYGIKLFVGPPQGGPLFFAHYSYMGFDPRDKKDDYANYFQQNINHTLINRAWCIDNPLNFEGYGENSWGLTASDDPWGYSAHAPGGATDNGTLTPAAAIPSMPYTPNESIEVLKHFYREYGDQLWGHFGFYDAFNPEVNWFADSYIAIDQGPIINMIENHRSGLLWSAFMLNSEIHNALDAIGFIADPSAVNEVEKEFNWTVYPTMTEDKIFIHYEGDQSFHIQLTDILGRQLPYSVNSSGSDTYIIHPDDGASGWIWISLSVGDHLVDTKGVFVF